MIWVLLQKQRTNGSNASWPYCWFGNTKDLLATSSTEARSLVISVQPIKNLIGSN